MLVLRSLTLAALFGIAGSGAARAGAPVSNDTFFDADVLPPGTLSVEDGLFFEGFAADLYLGAFDGSGDLIDFNDDDSPIGDGFAPALEGVPVNPGGEIDFAITGFDDTDFEGIGTVSGDYTVELTIFDSTGDFLDGFFYRDFLDFESVVTYFESDPAWEDGTYDVIVNNEIPNDLDFFRFTGLTPGESFSAETQENGFGVVDTFIGVFDESGDPIATDDDGGDDIFSKVFGVVPANGEVVIAVTGFNDTFFDGEHSSRGDYRLVLTPGVAEPLMADFNGDGTIDLLDLDILGANFGSTGATMAQGDANGDGTVDLLDLDILGSQFGSGAASASIPEPTAAAILLIAIATFGIKRQG